MKRNLMEINDLPEIPQKILTFWGEVINGHDDIWLISDVASKETLNFSKVSNIYLRHTIKLYIGTQAVSKSLWHTKNSSKRLINTLSCIDSPKLEERLVKEISEYIIANRNTPNEHQAWYLKSWYLWCSDMCLPYFNDDFADYLTSISIAGNPKGQAVMSLEENHGPLTDFELSAFTKLLTNDLNVSQGKVLAYLFLTLGCNPRNLSLLKWEDFSVISDEKYSLYFLKVPRIKKRNKNRSEFKLRELDQRIGKVVQEFKKPNASEYVFSNQFGTAFTSQQIQVEFSKYVKELIQWTEISSINITPRRLRYTFATQLVMSGVSKERLADLLDHSDLQHVQVYYDLRHKIKGFLTEVENQKIGDIFRRFEGTIISDKSDLNKDIKYYSKKPNSSLGKCGSDTSCDLNAPYSCFVCKKFNAFSDCVDTYKELRDDLVTWKKSRSEEFDENDKIQYQMDEVLSALKDLISRIENKNG